MRDYKRSKPKGKCIGIFGLHYMSLKYPNRSKIVKNVGEIEGVKWFLGIERWRLPISSGIPKQFDIIIPAHYTPPIYDGEE